MIFDDVADDEKDEQQHQDDVDVDEREDGHVPEIGDEGLLAEKTGLDERQEDNADDGGDDDDPFAPPPPHLGRDNRLLLVGLLIHK